MAAVTWALVGPTASGKSAVAMALAQAVGGEIVSCDSVQVYRDFEIGCAKPTASERALVPHHLLDVAAWDEPFDAQRYRALARDAISAIHARGRPAFVCGGTGLYLRALRHGLVDLPPASPEIRARLQAREAEAPGSSWRELERLDPETAARIDRHNLVYVWRALEIHALTGQPASRVRAQHGFAREELPMQVVALEWPLPALKERIVARTTAMLAAGLEDEVASLLVRGVLPTARPMTAVGYREVTEVRLGRAPRAALAERIVASTYAYARRQRTWLKREQGVQWRDARDLEGLIAALKLEVTRAMEHRP